MSELILALKPRRVHLSAAEGPDTAQKAFEEILLKQHQHTEKYRIGRALDAAVHDNGLIMGKYMLTSTALSQFCLRLCPGLGQVVSALIDGYKDMKTSEKSVRLAIWMIDQTLNLSYRNVDGCCWIIDTDLNTIEGLVGRKYKFVSNWDLIQRVKDYVLASSKKSRPTFAEAVLYGRRMIARYRDARPAFDLGGTHGSDVYYGGFHFANSEVGEYAIRAATMVLRQQCDNKAISPFQDGGRLTHLAGKKFDRRFSELLEGVTMKAELLKKFRAKLEYMRSTRLGLGEAKDKHEAAVKSLSKQLRLRGLTAKFTETVIDHVISQGSYSSQRIRVGQNPLTVAATRTLYDLFNAITAEAKQLSLSAQEEAEQVAYKLIRT